MYSVWQMKLLAARVLDKAKLKPVALRVFLSTLKGAPEANKAEVHYRVANSYEKLGDLEGAQVHLLHAIAAKPSVPHWWYKLGLVQQKLGDLPGALASFEHVVEMRPLQTSATYRVAQTLGKLNDTAGAMNTLRDALNMEPETKRYHTLMIQLARKTNQQPVVKQALESAVQFFPDDRPWISSLIDIYDATAEHELALEILEPFNASAKADATSLFWEGRALENLGRHEAAEAKLLKAVELQNPDRKVLGPGHFYQQKRQFPQAISLYRKSLESDPRNFAIHFQLGRCLEAEYEWAEAEAAYQYAVESATPEAAWLGRLGIVRERQGKSAEAAGAYRDAIALDEAVDGPWSYRYIKNRSEANDLGELPAELLASTEATVQALTKNLKGAGKSTETADSVFRAFEKHAEAGLKYLAVHDYSQAATEFEAAVNRSSSHWRSLYLAWTLALLKSGQTRQATETYLRSRLVQGSSALETRGLLKARESQQRIYYSEFVEDLPIDEAGILYESGAGITVACNPLAICRELLEREEYANFRHYWAVGKDEAVPDYLRSNPNVYFVRRNSDLYLKVLASAKYLINNNTFPPFFSRRPEQKYLNTWHGVPLKTLGVDIKNGQMDHRNAARNLLHTTHLLLPNNHTGKVLLERYDIQGLFGGKTAHLGYPRIDNVVAPRPETSASIRQRLGLTGEARVLLYAPTWRGDLKTASLDEAKILADLEQLESTGYKVLFRGHTMVEKILAESVLKQSLVPADIDTNDLLAVVDVLVTDYSSIFFDFIPTGKPIFYYAYDLPEYKRDRGMYFELEDMPGQVCTDIESLVAGVSGLTSWELGARSDYHAAMETFCPNEDGKATGRAIDFLFHDLHADSVEPVKNPRINALFYQGSFIPNGITSAFSNLIANLDLNKVRPVLMVLPGAVFSRPEREENLRALSDKTQMLGLIGGQLGTLEERLVIADFNAELGLRSELKKAVYVSAYEREYKRLFGSAHFDSAISFEGFQRHCSALISVAPEPRFGRSIMLHSAMKNERDTRFRHLAAIFSLYPRFDHLISVSESVNEVNREDIMAETDMPADRFVVAENILELGSIRTLGLEPIEEEAAAWMAAADYCFINVARLSPEKDHQKLLRALASARAASGKDLRLVLVGDGTIRGTLEELCLDLGIAEAVLFTGLLSNPYPYVKAADCFAFSSNYEGQGLAVLESLVLGTPVVSTDVVGPRSILEGGFGALVENSVEGLSAGLLTQALERPVYREFDADAYNAEALRKFNKIVFGL